MDWIQRMTEVFYQGGGDIFVYSLLPEQTPALYFLIFLRAPYPQGTGFQEAWQAAGGGGQV